MTKNTFSSRLIKENTKMKTKILYTLFALSLLAISCQKSDYCDDINEIKDAIVITASYDSQSETKTTLSNDDYLTPLWSVGDQIWVSDGTNDKTITLAASGTALSDENGVISADSKSFQFTSPSSSASSTIYAVYPASCANNAVSEGKISINIPSVQDGTFASANICAAQGVMNISFKNVVSILKVTQEDGANEYMWYNVGKPVAGDFLVNANGTLSDASNTSNAINGAISGEIGYYALAPVTPTENQTLTLKKSSETVAVEKTIVKATAYQRNYFYKVVAPDGDYTGMFSVSSSTKVAFSPGNLYWNGSAFMFEDNQWSYSSTWTENSHISHFYWYNYDNIDKSYAEEYDWELETFYEDVFFTNKDQTTPSADFTVEGQSGKWRTLSGGSGGEWEYLLTGRTVNGGTGDGNSYQRATINSDATGVYGLIIYPDNYTAQTTTTSYTSSDWQIMEAAGCVFLPAAGYRTGSSVYFAGSYGYYWSSTASDAYGAYGLNFISSLVYPASLDSRGGGRSVRLVQTIN